MTGPVFLGSQRVCRSAHAEQTATALTIYLGVCARDNRPVRFEYPADMGPAADIPCPECTLPVTGERLHAVTTTLTCDGACRSARRPWCECGCGGINHGNLWTAGALIGQREVVESALATYRADQARIAAQRQARLEAAARRQQAEFGRWAAEHQDLIAALGPWYEHRADDAWQSQQGRGGQHILAGFALQTHGPAPRPLTGPQAGLARRILTEHAEHRRAHAARARRDAERAARGAGDQATLVPGVYCRDGQIFVVKGNRAYISWRKHNLGQPRPAEARLYAKRLAESPPRVTEAGTEVSFELVYAPGVIYDLAPADRLPLADAEQLATRYGKCIACGATLKAAKSVREAIGPVCRKYFGPVLDGQQQPEPSS
jgi:hypothetical protein